MKQQYVKPTKKSEHDFDVVMSYLTAILHYFSTFPDIRQPMPNYAFAKLFITGGAIAGLIYLFACTGARGAGKDRISFNFDVRPILSDRCFKCHGPDEKQRKAGLRLDTQEGATVALGEKKDHYAIVPGHPEQSTLVHRIQSTNPDSIMPSPDSHLTLSDAEKEILAKWIEQGANWEKHWAFIVPEKMELPEVKDSKWAKNPIDHFILAQQEKKGLPHQEEAGKERLARRAAFDLTGLPPSPEMLDRFLNNSGDDAYEKYIDELLASPAYGERWAVYWLDLARYSDTHGYQDDLTRVMWPWRDWVIKAFNENMPYNQFVTWQLAGDLLPEPTKEMLLATGFNRNHKITQEGGVIDEEYRVEYVADRTNTFGKAFLGLTMECARCHDHKYDPISARDYYSTSAFFNKVDEDGFVPNLATPKPYMKVTLADANGALRFLNVKETLKTEKDSMLLMIMQDSVKNGGRTAYILKRGQYDQHGDSVTADLPATVLPFDTTLPKNRLGMSEWLFDRRNPLTARVMVNRLWQEIFGKGIVATSDNFGIQGALPSHPELLDWLAADFRDNGWDIKKALRQMVTSATYRQSSVADESTREKDPENTWLTRGPRFRMYYEFIRDNALVAAGLLNPEIGGPPVRPYQPPGLWEAISTEKTANNFRGEATYVPDTSAAKKYRRSLYTFNRRTIPPPTTLSFDAAPRDVCEVRRNRTSTPLQALVMLNDPQIMDASRILAEKLLAKYPTDARQSITDAFKKILTRAPENKELAVLQELYQSELVRFHTSPDRAKSLLQKTTANDPAAHAALTLTLSAIFNLDEAMSKS